MGSRWSVLAFRVRRGINRDQVATTGYCEEERELLHTGYTRYVGYEEAAMVHHCLRGAGNESGSGNGCRGLHRV